MDHRDDTFKSGSPWDDDDEDYPYGDEWDDDDEWIEEGERSESERWDIPDLPDPNLLSDAQDRALPDTLFGVFAEDGNEDFPIESFFETGDREGISGLSRTLLSLSRQGFASFGSSLCRYLVEDLKQYSDKLLFGLIDGIYLHSTRSMVHSKDRVCVGVRVFWDPAPSPYPLLADASAISGNPDLIYLLVGDLVEDLINGIEKATREADGNGGDAS